MAETTGLLNRLPPKGGTRVRIPPPPQKIWNNEKLFLYLQKFIEKNKETIYQLSTVGESESVSFDHWQHGSRIGNPMR